MSTTSPFALMPASVAYFIHRDQQTTGPFSEDEVRAKFHAGEIQDDTLVAKEGSTQWTPLSETTLSEPKIQLKTDAAGAAAAASDLQFDRAEFAQPKSGAVTCSICKQPVHDAYFHINGRVACAACKERIETSGAGRVTMIGFGKSVLFGAGAAIAGAVVWYAVSELTHAQWGLIGIVVGLMVGLAVRKGSRGWGGWQYQALAMVLTYFAIVGTYVPPLFAAMKSHLHASSSTAVKGTDSAQSNSMASNDDGRADDQDTTTNSLPTDSRPHHKSALASVLSRVPKPLRHGVGIVLLSVVIFAIACALPFLEGPANFMGWIIIAIALYQAWKINRRVPLEITGPHKIAPTPGAA